MNFVPKWSKRGMEIGLRMNLAKLMREAGMLSLEQYTLSLKAFQQEIVELECEKL